MDFILFPLLLLLRGKSLIVFREFNLKIVLNEIVIEKVERTESKEKRKY